MNDPIVDEVRQVRDAHAARFNYDLDAIFQDNVFHVDALLANGEPVPEEDIEEYNEKPRPA